MIKYVSEYEFRSNERLQRNFTFHGLEALFNWFTEFEQEIGEELNFDPVSICCEFADYKNLEEIKGDYPEIRDLEDLEEKTQVIIHEQGIIINKF